MELLPFRGVLALVELTPAVRRRVEEGRIRGLVFLNVFLIDPLGVVEQNLVQLVDTFVQALGFDPRVPFQSVIDPLLVRSLLLAEFVLKGWLG